MTLNLKKLKTLCNKYNVSFSLKSSSHVQIKGHLLVNYYPLSKNKTAYIAGMVKSYKDISYERAFELSVTVPERAEAKTKRKNNYVKEKKKLLKRKPFCNWCGKTLELHTATVDHVIPLSIGGLNNMNNYVLACYDCNQKRGSKMPEITNIKTR